MSRRKKASQKKKERGGPYKDSEEVGEKRGRKRPGLVPLAGYWKLPLWPLDCFLVTVG